MLELRNVTKSFTRRGFGKNPPAVDRVSFTVERGQAVGLVGASGSGKSTVARLITRLIKATSGSIYYDGENIINLSPREFRPYRRKIQIIFQQPSQALDPRRTIHNALLEPLSVHGITASRREADRRIKELLEETNLSTDILNRRPHEISGGQAQRVVIARALSLEPELLIADEPTSMLDLSIQAQILAILSELRTKRQLSLLLISHDPSVVRATCGKAAVLENGRLVKFGDPSTVLDHSTSLIHLGRRNKMKGYHYEK